MMYDKKFLTITEAAELLQVSQTSLRRWTNSGKLRCLRVGGRQERRFLLKDLLAFMQSSDDESSTSIASTAEVIEHYDYHDRHICLFFHNPEEQWQLMGPYLLPQLEAKMPVLYIQDSTIPEQLLTRLNAEGLDTERLIEQELLRIIPSDRAYLVKGYFDVQRMLTFMLSAILAARAAGHARVLLTGEMSWSFTEAPGVEQMMTYETLLNPIVEKYPEVTIICQYDLSRFDGTTVLDALLTHPSAQLANGMVAGFYDT